VSDLYQITHNVTVSYDHFLVGLQENKSASHSASSIEPVTYCTSHR